MTRHLPDPARRTAARLLPPLAAAVLAMLAGACAGGTEVPGAGFPVAPTALAPAAAREEDRSPAPRTAGLFGRVETAASPRAFSRGRRALAQVVDELADDGEDCEPSFWRRCDIGEWRRFVAGLAGKDRRDQLEAVNWYVNRARYVTDSRNYGVADHWATAGELFDRGGDCEDYVIVKYASLRALGVPAEDMRVVVVIDTRRRLGHAVLVVRVDGRDHVLDNQSPRVERADAVQVYRPIYALNERGGWLYRSREAVASVAELGD